MPTGLSAFASMRGPGWLVQAALCSLKEKVKGLFQASALYQRARVSWIYDVYWALADPHILEDGRAEVGFYQSLLDGLHAGDLIFDIGANQGHKTDVFLRLGARVVAVDPDALCVDMLEKKFLRYRLSKKPVSIVRKAVSDGTNIETIWIDAPGSGMNTLSRKWAETLKADDGRFARKFSFGRCSEVETVSITQLVSTHGSPFFVKIDVEGHELSVLRGMERPVPYLSFEVNLPEFRPEGLECVSTLACLAPQGRFNYTADCRDGLALKQWLGAEKFCTVLNACAEKSVEVFFRAGTRIEPL